MNTTYQTLTDVKQIDKALKDGGAEDAVDKIIETLLFDKIGDTAHEIAMELQKLGYIDNNEEVSNGYVALRLLEAIKFLDGYDE